MDRTEGPSYDNNSNTGNQSEKSSRVRGKEDTPTKSRGRDVTPDGKRETSDKKRKEGGKSSGTKHKSHSNTSSTSSSPISLCSSNGTSNGNGAFSSRHYYREVPPRFQQHKHTTSKHSSSKSPHSKSNQPLQGNKKGKDSNRWPSSQPGTVDNNWSLSLDETSIQSVRGKGDTGIGNNNPWHMNNDKTLDNWTSEDELTNSDPVGEDLTNESDRVSSGKHDDIGKRRSQDEESDSEEFDDESTLAGLDSQNSFHGQRFRNSDSDAMKDGTSMYSHSSYIRESPEDPQEGLGGEGGIWRGHPSRSSMGSTSSVNSAGSSSSWKGGSMSRSGSYQRSSSPRKQTRFDNHRTVPITGIGRGSKFPLKPKKPVMDLDDAIESLHNEPSGWGELPSPKPTDMDTGTDVWGIPDDVKMNMKKKNVTRNGGGNGPGWGDTPLSHDEWGDDGTLTAGWDNHNMTEDNGSTDVQQWGREPGWNTIVSKGKERNPALRDNIKLLVDMGFSPIECEDVLQRNNNNFEASLGDLLALTTVKEEESQQLSPPNFLPTTSSGSSNSRALKYSNSIGSNNRLSPSSSQSGGTSPRTISPSSTPGGNNDFYQQLHGQMTQNGSMSGTQPTTTTSFPSQNHLMQLQLQKQQPPLPQRTMSTPHGQLSGVSLQNVQALLTRQLKQYYLLKQQLTMQMSQLKSSSANPSQKQQQQQLLTIQLNQVNGSILLANQHLLVTEDLVQQDIKGNKDIGTLNGHSQGSDGFNREVSTHLQRSMSSSDVKGLSYSMQNVSLSGNGNNTTSTTISQSSARTISRLQQIISCNQESQNTDNSDQNNQNEHLGMELPSRKAPSPSNPITTLPNYIRAREEEPTIMTEVVTSNIPKPTLATSLSLPLSNQNTSMTSSTKFVRSVDDIQEFKPGVPWTPQNPNHGNIARSQSGHMTGHMTDTKPDSIPPSPITFPDSSFGGSMNIEYYSPNDGPNTFGSGFNPPSQFRRHGNMGSNPRYGGNGNHQNYINSSTNGGGYRPIGRGFQRPPLPPQGPVFVQSQFNPGRNRQRAYSQSQQQGGYSDHHLGQMGEDVQARFSMQNNNKGFDSSGRKWSFDSNPWGVPEKSGSIWSMDSSESLLSPEINYTEWKAPNRKPSLPINLSAPTCHILLKNVSSQIDETSIREVCSEYGQVRSCNMNPFNDTVLVCYRSKEEALQAKLGLERNPLLCGTNVSPSFATERDISTFFEQKTPNQSVSLSSAVKMGTATWLPTDPKIMPAGSHKHQDPGKNESSVWGPEFSAPGGPSISGSNSVWSNGGILPGISTPWNSQSTYAPGPEGGDDVNVISTSPSLSTFLPNGLF